MHNRRESYRFRPGCGGITLEDRVVLSQTRVNSFVGYEQYLLGRGNINPWAHYGAPTAAPASVGAVYKQQVGAGFADLLATLTDQADTYLAAIGSSTAATARQTFEAQSQGALKALSAQLTSQIALLGPSSNRYLQGPIQQQLLGTASTSLATALSQLPYPATGTGNDATAFQLRISNAVASARNQAEVTIGNFIQARGLTHQNLARTRQNPAGHPVSDQYRNVLQGSFAGLANDYALGAGPLLSGTVAEIATNRPDFDANTEASVNSLAATLTSAFLLTPGASDQLIPAIQERLLGDGGLLDELNALADPTDTDGSSAETFGNDAGRMVAVAYNNVNALYNQFIRGRSIDFVSTSVNQGFGGGFGGFGFGYIPVNATTPAPDLDPTFLQQFGFTNELLGQGPNAPTFTYGTTSYGADNGLSTTSGFNLGFNNAFTPPTGLNYARTGGLNRTLFGIR
ncbi:MAG: hypothetical protein U0794_21985 [Isosphaeraceae bacterium]